MAQALKTQNKLLMPKATAVWLIENTALTFRQIAEFTALTEIEIEALANEDIGRGLVGRDPVEHGEVSRDQLKSAEADSSVRMKMLRNDLPPVKIRAKGPRYTPVSKRSDKPDAISYILKNNPDIKDSKICKLLGTTKPTINAVRDRTHPNAQNIKPRHPAEVGLCTYQEYEIVANKALKAAGKDPEKIKAEKQAAMEQKQKEDNPLSAGFDFSNFLSSGNKPSGNNNDDPLA